MVAPSDEELQAQRSDAGWTYNMYGMVQLDDTVEISVERVGKVRHGGIHASTLPAIAGFSAGHQAHVLHGAVGQVRPLVERSMGDHRTARAPQRFKRHVAHVVAINGHRTFRHVVEPGQQAHDGGLAGAGRL